MTNQVVDNAELEIVSDPSVLINPHGEPDEQTYELPKALARAIGFSSTAERLSVKSWSNFQYDPWEWIGSTNGSPLGQVSDISVALTKTGYVQPPYFTLRSVISYSKTSLGWYTTPPGQKLTIQYKDRNDAVIYSYEIMHQLAPYYRFEVEILCRHNNEPFTHEHRMNVDLYDDIYTVMLITNPTTWRKCS